MDSTASDGIQEMSTSFVFPMNFQSDLSSRVGLIPNQHLNPMQQMSRIKEDLKSRDDSIASKLATSKMVSSTRNQQDPKKPSNAQIVAQNYHKSVTDRRGSIAEQQEYPLKKMIAEEQLRRDAQKRQ